MTTRHLVILSAGLFSLCGAVNASAQPRWGRDGVPQAGACFFEDRNFGGRYFCVRPGEDLRSMPSGMGDRISSIRLLGPSEVTVFRDNDMRGRTAHFTNDVSDLKRDGWNDEISSIAVAGGRYDTNGYGNNGNRNGRAYGRNRNNNNRYGNNGAYGNGGGYGNNGAYDNYGGWDPNRAPVWGSEVQPRDGACFYEDANYRGQYFCVPRGGTYTSLPRGFNDRISSVRVFGAQVRIYQDRDFRGRSSQIRRDTSDLRGSWRDTVSSIRVE